MKIDNKFEFEEEVYLKTDPDQRKRMIISMEVYPQGEMMYRLICNTTTSYHYAFEISRERDILMTTDN